MDMNIRPRRLRNGANLRKMVRETRMDKSSLIYPMFVKEGTGIKEEIPDALEITVRENENVRYYIYQNFGTEAVNIPVPEGQISWIYGNGSDKLKVYGLAVAKVIV